MMEAWGLQVTSIQYAQCNNVKNDFIAIRNGQWDAAHIGRWVMRAEF